MPRTVPTKPIAGIAQATNRTIDSSESSRSVSRLQVSRIAKATSWMLRVAPKRCSPDSSARGSSSDCSAAGNASICRAYSRLSSGRMRTPGGSDSRSVSSSRRARMMPRDL